MVPKFLDGFSIRMLVTDERFFSRKRSTCGPQATMTQSCAGTPVFVISIVTKTWAQRQTTFENQFFPSSLSFPHEYRRKKPQVPPLRYPGFPAYLVTGVPQFPPYSPKGASTDAPGPVISKRTTSGVPSGSMIGRPETWRGNASCKADPARVEA